MRLKLGPVIQHGYVVADAEKSARAWTERTGVGPFYLVEQPVDDYVFRGNHQNLTLRIAVSYWNDLQIELIQPIKGEETFYSEALRNEPEKLNHYAVLVPDIDAMVRNFQLERFVVQQGIIPSVRFLYIEKYLPDQSVLEFMQVDQRALQGFEAIKAICRSWDGVKPIRAHDDLSHDIAALQKPI
jgi:hypothetical protein